MNSITTIAISKAISASAKATKEARKALDAGTYNVKTTVELEGTLVVGEDEEATATASLLNEEFLALVLHHSGITKQAALNAIQKVADEYLVNWTGSDADKKAAKEARKELVAKYDPEGNVKKTIDSVKKRLPKIKKAGKVKFNGQVTEVKRGLSIVPELEERSA